jgi:hypothetical protein
LTSIPSDINSAELFPKVNEGEESQYFMNNLSFLTFAYRENLFVELEQLVDKGKLFDGLIIDVMQTGFTLPLESLVKFSFYAQRLLNQHGVLLFVKADGAITLTKDDPGGGLTFYTYDSPFGIFTRHPMLADYVCATVGGIDRRRLQEGGNTLANHILYTSVPVLTELGQKAKVEFSLVAPHHWVIQAIDDYTTVEVITRVMESHQRLAPDETMRIIQELESQALIFPVFPRIQFLANCYRNRKSFRLGRYMVAATIITESQLRELLERQSEEGWGKSQKTYLGLLAIRAGYINARELEVLLDDQYLYGGYHRKADEKGMGHTSSIDTVRDSIIGSLGATDPNALLQSLSGGNKTGLLTVEKRDKAFIIAFQQGKPTYARLSKLKGANALTEFVTTWSDGIFVFRDKATSQDLDSDCTLDKPLDRILIDAAICHDHMIKNLDSLPQGRNSILERVSNFEALWNSLCQQNLKYMDDTMLTDDDKASIEKLSYLIDGFSTLDEVIKSFDIWPSHKIAKAVKLLIDNNLVNIQNASLLRPLSIFQRIATELQNTIGQEENRELLISSLRYVHGNSDAASRFIVDSLGRISLNLSQAKHSDRSLSNVILELRHWMEAYLVYCKKKIPAEIVNKIVATIVNTEMSR